MASRSKTARRLGLAVVAGGAVLVGRKIASMVATRRPLIEPVAPELRHPALYLPIELRDERTLNIARRLISKVRQPGLPHIDVTTQVAQSDGGGYEPQVVISQRRDRDRPSGALLWIHGGGMVMGEPVMDQRWCTKLAQELGILVVSVDYRLAPEHPYPAPVDDCMTALRWLHDQADELGVDPDRIAVGGSSAGGGLAAATSLRARDEGGPRVCFQLLNYPMLDDRTVLVHDQQGRGNLIWTPNANRFGWSAYLAGEPGGDEVDIYAAPSRATDLAGLPPAWIGVGSLDLFWPEDLDYAARLVEAGVPCQLHEVPDMYHGADGIVPKADSMRDYTASMVTALRAALSPS